MNSIANYVCIDGNNTYCGDDYQGNVYVAKVDLSKGERFKHAIWTPATGEQTEYYCAARRAERAENLCPDTGESVFYCTCGWH